MHECKQGHTFFANRQIIIVRKHTCPNLLLKSRAFGNSNLSKTKTLHYFCNRNKDQDCWFYSELAVSKLLDYHLIHLSIEHIKFKILTSAELNVSYFQIRKGCCASIMSLIVCFRVSYYNYSITLLAKQ